MIGGPRASPYAGAALVACAVLFALPAACRDDDVAWLGAELTSEDAGADAGACPQVCAGGAAACGVDYCSALPMLSADPVIDGTLECGLALAGIDASNWTGAGPKPADLRVEYAAAWRPTGMYVFAHVIESQRLPAPEDAGAPIFCGDATHVFADSDGVFADPPAYDDPGTRQLIAGAPADATDAVSIGVMYTPAAAVGAWAPTHFRAFPVPDGYVLEAFVVASDLGLTEWSLNAGGHVGFDLSISYGGDPSAYGDASDCAKRGDFFLQAVELDGGGVSLPHDDVSAFCTPSLLSVP